ncbi:MAG: MlaD family protein [Paludibacteraceae bacterium]|nr:MlaD family protein [Paludibacteraceae bacterium]
MKYKREIKIGALALVCIFLMYFGFYFLKGVNIFTSVHSFHGHFEQVKGLEEQAPVYIKGYRVGQVDHIFYDFTRDSAFNVDISIKKDIRLPYGTTMALVSDGLMGGAAIQLNLPLGTFTDEYKDGDVLPTIVVPGLMEDLQNNLLGSVASVATHADSLIVEIKNQLADNHLYNTLSNVDQMSADLKVISVGLKDIVQYQLSPIVQKADSSFSGLNEVISDVRAADLPAIFANVDTSMTAVKNALTEKEGTLGKLLYDNDLYTHIDAAVVSVDSLVSDLKQNPKRYVHFSLFGKKNK